MMNVWIFSCTNQLEVFRSEMDVDALSYQHKIEFYTMKPVTII